MDRRTFVQRGAMAAAALALPERILRDPYAPLERLHGSPVRVTGRVADGARGIAGVGVTDGVSIVTTDSAGRFALIADGSRPFVHICTPAGYRIPVAPTGTARFHQPLRPDGRGEMRAEFALERAGRDDRHAFLVLADIQTQNAFEMGRLHGETVPDVSATVAALDGRVAFGMACGDIMFDDLTLYPDYERAVRGFGTPFFQVVGNHDLSFDARSDEASTSVFERHFGPTYYSFDRGEVHYVVLDDVLWHGAGYIGYVDERQLAWLSADLARVERGKPVVVFLHIPVLSTRARRQTGSSGGITESVANRDALYRLLEPFTAYVMSGHTHEHEHHRDGAVQHHVHGTVCGAWWSGDICSDGTPNGYSIYEVSGSAVRRTYKATGRPAGHQARVYRPGVDPAAPDDLVANVWDADERWTVTLHEDGARRGLMSRRLGLDPRSVSEHTGPDKPARRAWVEPTRTNHLYYAAVSPGVREMHVEAIDPWGRRYVEPLKLD